MTDEKRGFDPAEEKAEMNQDEFGLVIHCLSEEDIQPQTIHLFLYEVFQHFGAFTSATYVEGNTANISICPNKRATYAEGKEADIEAEWTLGPCLVLRAKDHQQCTCLELDPTTGETVH